MKATSLALMIPLFVLASTLDAQQIGVTWNPGSAEPGLWSNPANWGGTVPVSGYKAFLNIGTVGPCIVDGVAGGCQLTVGDGGGPCTLMVTNGGSLTAGDTAGDIHLLGWTAIGVGNNGNGTIIVENGGSVNFVLHLWIGSLDSTAHGNLIINGGTAAVTNNVDSNWQLGTATGPASYIRMNGGTLFLGKFDDTSRIRGSSVMDIAGGTVIVNGNRTDNINTLHAAGRITAYGGAGTLNVDYNNLNSGKTTITATPGTALKKIISLSIDAGTVTIKYETTPGSTYHLESSATLMPGSWSTVPGSAVTAANTEETFSFPIPNDAKQFFRTASP